MSEKEREAPENPKPVLLAQLYEARADTQERLRRLNLVIAAAEDPDIAPALEAAMELLNLR